MFRTARFHRQARFLLLLGVCLLIISGFPARPADAATVTQPIDNSLAEFTRGTFQRSSLSTLRANPPGIDEAGAVQLAPIGVLKDWFDSPFLLPEKLTDIGAVAMGNRLFVIGGLVGSTRTAHVWSTAVDQVTGAPLSEWQAEPNLPAVRTSDQTVPNLIAPVAARSLASVAAVQTDAVNNSGYIYVIGGTVNPAGAAFNNSSYAVTIGTVSNGRITAWAASSDLNTQLRIPANQGGPPPAVQFQNGVQAAPTVTFTTGGNTYIYLLGGLMRYYEGVQAVEVGSNRVFYAKVRTSDGMLVKPSNGAVGWDRLADIPLPTNEGLANVAGLWDGTAVANHFDDLGGLGGNVLYLMGGQFQSSVGNDQVTDAYNAHVFRALINGSSGALTWTSAAGPNQWQGTLPEARVGMGAVEFRGTLYVTGGRPVSGTPAQPQPAVLTSYVEDDLKLAQIGTSGSNFIINPNVLQNKPRTRHGTVVVPATPTVQAPNAAFVYVIAGQGSGTDSDPSDDQGSNTLIYGKIGTSEDVTENGYASSGWYYSTPHDMRSTTAQVQKIEWATTITGTRPMDIQMQFRTSTANDCFDPGAFSTANWSSVLDGSTGDQYFSKAGANQVNSVNQATPPSHCFQYRVKLINTSAGGKATPSLLNVRIQVVIPGYPDLKVQTLQPAKFGSTLTGLNVQIVNKNTVETTQPANIEGGGSFYVDLFVFGPGQTPVTPTLPLDLHPGNPPSAACASVAKIALPPEAVLSITDWYDPATCVTQRKNLISLFTNPGHYVVIAAVDSTCGPALPNACVTEGSTGGESNNLKRLEFDVAKVGYVMLLPSVRRKP
jgi:hypothetical protein